MGGNQFRDTLRLSAIPFHHKLSTGEIPLAKDWRGAEHGSHPVVTEAGGLRRYALVHVPVEGGGTRPLPFYTHSNSNSKKGVSEGDWLPYFGEHEETGWLNKVPGVEQHFGKQSLQRVAEGLKNLVPDGPVPRGGDVARYHINGILRQHWGVKEFGKGPNDPVAQQNADHILSQISHK